MTRRFTCDRCGLAVSAEDESEVVRLVRDHAERAHGWSVSRAEVRRSTTPVSSR
jgi:predicted small metal-binding protein